MNDALRDSNKVPSILAIDDEGKETIPIKATKSGALKVSLTSGDEGESSSNTKEYKVIRLDLSKSREKELFNESFKEITVPVVDGNFTLFIGDDSDDKGMTINRALSISTKADKFFVSNGSGKGHAELWLWK